METDAGTPRAMTCLCLARPSIWTEWASLSLGLPVIQRPTQGPRDHQKWERSLFLMQSHLANLEVNRNGGFSQLA